MSTHRFHSSKSTSSVGPLGAVNPSVVDQDVQGVERGVGHAEKVFDLVRGGNVAALRQHALTRQRDVGLQLRGQGRGGVFVAGAEKDVRSFADEGFHDGASEALAAAGDEGVAVGEFHVGSRMNSE